MKAFRFRLERILSWQRTQQEICESGIKQLLARLERMDAMLAQLKAGQAAAENEVLRAPLLDPRDLSALSSYRRWVKKREAEIFQSRQDCEKRLAEQRRIWTEKERRCRLMEKLKARQRTAFEAELGREIENFASEAFLARWKCRAERAVRSQK